MHDLLIMVDDHIATQYGKDHHNQRAGNLYWATIMEWQRVLNTSHYNFLHGTPT